MDVFSVFRVESVFNRECFSVFLSSGDSDRSRFMAFHNVHVVVSQYGMSKFTDQRNSSCM